MDVGLSAWWNRITLRLMRTDSHDPMLQTSWLQIKTIWLSPTCQLSFHTGGRLWEYGRSTADGGRRRVDGRLPLAVGSLDFWKSPSRTPRSKFMPCDWSGFPVGELRNWGIEEEEEEEEDEEEEEEEVCRREKIYWFLRELKRLRHALTNNTDNTSLVVIWYDVSVVSNPKRQTCHSSSSVRIFTGLARPWPGSPGPHVSAEKPSIRFQRHLRTRLSG